MTTGRELLAEAARQESARVYGSLCKEHRSEPPARVSDRSVKFSRPLDSYYGPAPKDWIDALVEAIAEPTEGAA